MTGIKKFWDWVFETFQQAFGEYWFFIIGLFILLLVIMIYNKSYSVSFAGFVVFVVMITLSFLVPEPFTTYIYLLIALLLAFITYKTLKNP
ncbi:MAG TPA: hypothetical protein EYH56_00625 [Nanoarchaeota archaeon]|nr:hypothetical protein [Nanoarchaeota archaeon]